MNQAHGMSPRIADRLYDTLEYVLHWKREKKKIEDLIAAITARVAATGGAAGV